jgi:hypothetical protein
VARDFASQFKVSLPILVDTIENRVEQAYSAMPDRIYVIDAKGKIAYAGDRGPAGFHASDVPPVLDRLLGVQIAGKLKLPDTRAQKGGGPVSMDRVRDMLETAGLDEKDIKYVLVALEQRMEAYRPLMKARMALVGAARKKEEMAAALQRFEAAEKEYVAACERIDKKLDEAIGYRERPRVEAILIALGLIGIQPAPPFSGLQNPGGGGSLGPKNIVGGTP